MDEVSRLLLWAASATADSGSVAAVTYAQAVDARRRLKDHLLSPAALLSMLNDGGESANRTETTLPVTLTFGGLVQVLKSCVAPTTTPIAADTETGTGTAPPRQSTRAPPLSSPQQQQHPLLRGDPIQSVMVANGDDGATENKAVAGREEEEEEAEDPLRAAATVLVIEILRDFLVALPTTAVHRPPSVAEDSNDNPESNDDHATTTATPTTRLATTAVLPLLECVAAWCRGSNAAVGAAAAECLLRSLQSAAATIVGEGGDAEAENEDEDIANQELLCFKNTRRPPTVGHQLVRLTSRVINKTVYSTPSSCRGGVMSSSVNDRALVRLLDAVHTLDAKAGHEQETTAAATTDDTSNNTNSKGVDVDRVTEEGGKTNSRADTAAGDVCFRHVCLAYTNVYAVYLSHVQNTLLGLFFIPIISSPSSPSAAQQQQQQQATLSAPQDPLGAISVLSLLPAVVGGLLHLSKNSTTTTRTGSGMCHSTAQAQTEQVLRLLCLVVSRAVFSGPAAVSGSSPLSSPSSSFSSLSRSRNPFIVLAMRKEKEGPNAVLPAVSPLELESRPKYHHNHNNISKRNENTSGTCSETLFTFLEWAIELLQDDGTSSTAPLFSLLYLLVDRRWSSFVADGGSAALGVPSTLLSSLNLSSSSSADADADAAGAGAGTTDRDGASTIDQCVMDVSTNVEITAPFLVRALIDILNIVGEYASPTNAGPGTDWGGCLRNTILSASIQRNDKAGAVFDDSSLLQEEDADADVIAEALAVREALRPPCTHWIWPEFIESIIRHCYPGCNDKRGKKDNDDDDPWAGFDEAVLKGPRGEALELMLDLTAGLARGLLNQNNRSHFVSMCNDGSSGSASLYAVYYGLAERMGLRLLPLVVMPMALVRSPQQAPPQQQLRGDTATVYLGSNNARELFEYRLYAPGTVYPQSMKQLHRHTHHHKSLRSTPTAALRSSALLLMAEVASAAAFSTNDPYYATFLNVSFLFGGLAPTVGLPLGSSTKAVASRPADCDDDNAVVDIDADEVPSSLSCHPLSPVNGYVLCDGGAVFRDAVFAHNEAFDEPLRRAAWHCIAAFIAHPDLRTCGNAGVFVAATMANRTVQVQQGRAPATTAVESVDAIRRAQLKVVDLLLRFQPAAAMHARLQENRNAGLYSVQPRALRSSASSGSANIEATYYRR